MRKNIGAKSFLIPMPVLIISAYDQEGTAHCMNAARGGISADERIVLGISPSHKTTKCLLEKGAFTVGIGDVENEVACDYVGITSGNDVPDKFARAGFTAAKSERVDAPVINELKMALECVVENYDKESHVLVGKIVDVSVDEEALDEEGLVDALKVNPLLYDSPKRRYFPLGEPVGKARVDGKKLK